MTCAKCGADRPAANLTTLPNGERWCPEDLFKKADTDSKHQTLARPPAATLSDFEIVDVPRMYLPSVRMQHRIPTVWIKRRKG